MDDGELGTGTALHLWGLWELELPCNSTDFRNWRCPSSLQLTRLKGLWSSKTHLAKCTIRLLLSSAHQLKPRAALCFGEPLRKHSYSSQNSTGISDLFHYFSLPLGSNLGSAHCGHVTQTSFLVCHFFICRDQRAPSTKPSPVAGRALTLPATEYKLSQCSQSLSKL